MFMRRDCVFSSLTDEQQADLFDWLSAESYESVKKRIALPPPDGFGINAHINTLFRFFQQRQALNRARDLADVIAAIPPNSLSADPSSKSLANGAASAKDQLLAPQSYFLAASRQAHAHSTYVLSHSPLNPGFFRAVSRVLHQREHASIKREYLEVARDQLALARERLQFERAQFEFDAARAALAILPDLNAIHQRHDLDEEAKVARVRQRLFGISPSVEAKPD
jgi:hypothetical protein